MSRIIAVLMVMMITWANAQTAPAGQTQAPAPAAAASASASAGATSVPVNLGGLGGLSVRVGTATGTLTLEAIPIQVGPQKPTPRASANANASASARASANAPSADKGRLVVMRCDNTFTVTPTAEPGTLVHEARNCAPVAAAATPATVRIIEAPAVAPPVIAQATATASASPAASAQAVPVTRCRAISDGTLFKKGDTAQVRISRGTVVAVSIPDPSAPNAQLFSRVAGESCATWEKREVDPHYVRS